MSHCISLTKSDGLCSVSDLIIIMSFGELWTWAPIYVFQVRKDRLGQRAFLPLSTDERDLQFPEMPAGTIIDAVFV